LARDIFEIMPTVEDILYARGQRRLAPPIILNFARARIADNAGAEIGARQLGFGCGRALDRVIDRDVDRFDAEAGSVEVHGHG
jgi:hypothetical protein